VVSPIANTFSPANRGQCKGTVPQQTRHGQLNLWKNRDTNKVGIYRLPKKLDDEVSRLRPLQRDKPACTSTASA
jgi:hypothetical protein